MTTPDIAAIAEGLSENSARMLLLIDGAQSEGWHESGLESAQTNAVLNVLAMARLIERRRFDMDYGHYYKRLVTPLGHRVAEYLKENGDGG